MRKLFRKVFPNKPAKKLAVRYRKSALTYRDMALAAEPMRDGSQCPCSPISWRDYCIAMRFHFEMRAEEVEKL